VRKILGILIRKYDPGNRHRWSIVVTLIFLFVIVFAWLFPNLFPGSEKSAQQSISASGLLTHKSNIECSNDRECDSRSCDLGRCESLFELNTWAERKDLFRHISEALTSAPQEQQNGVDLALEKALAVHKEAFLGTRPRVLEAVSIHSNPLLGPKIWTDKSKDDDLELYLAFFRFQGLTQSPLSLKLPEYATQDLLLLFADAHPTALQTLCHEKKLRRAYPSFDARCARIHCGSNEEDAIHSSVQALRQYWDCATP